MTHRVSKQSAGTSSRSCLTRMSQRRIRTTDRFARIIFMTIRAQSGAARMRFNSRSLCARVARRLALAMRNHDLVKTNFRVAEVLS